MVGGAQKKRAMLNPFYVHTLLSLAFSQPLPIYFHWFQCEGLRELVDNVGSRASVVGGFIGSSLIYVGQKDKYKGGEEYMWGRKTNTREGRKG